MHNINPKRGFIHITTKREIQSTNRNNHAVTFRKLYSIYWNLELRQNPGLTASLSDILNSHILTKTIIYYKLRRETHQIGRERNNSLLLKQGIWGCFVKFLFSIKEIKLNIHNMNTKGGLLFKPKKRYITKEKQPLLKFNKPSSINWNSKLQ